MEQKITLTHLNVRQSIFILLAKLVFADLVLALVVIGLYFIVVQCGDYTRFASESTLIFLVTFGIMGIIKIALSAYIVLMWLNEYYEITPETVVHKSGIIFKKTEKYRLEEIREMDLQEGILGEMFQFGTITLYDPFLNKSLDMYLIHNPRRYARILKKLRPGLETKKDRVDLPFVREEDEL